MMEARLAARTLSSEFRFWVTRLPRVAASVRNGAAERSIDLVGLVDDSWPDAMDPCDPRFDRKEIALHVSCPLPPDDQKGTDWTQWEASGLSPIGYVRVAQAVRPEPMGAGFLPAIDAYVWLASEHFAMIDSVMTRGHEPNLRVEISFALSEPDLLPGAVSQLSRRYLRDLDVTAKKTFPVVDLTVQWTREGAE